MELQDISFSEVVKDEIKNHNEIENEHFVYEISIQNDTAHLKVESRVSIDSVLVKEEMETYNEITIK